MGASLLTLFVATAQAPLKRPDRRGPLPARAPDDPHRPHHVQHQLRGGHGPGPDAGLPAAPRGGRDGPRGERVDDVLEGHLPADLPGHHGRRAAVLQPVDRRLRHHPVLGRHANTFPLWVWAAIRNNLPPQVQVIGTIIFVGAVGLVVLSTLIAAPLGAPRRPGLAVSRRWHEPGGPAAVDTADVPRDVDRPARPLRRPAGLGPDHEPRPSTAARARGSSRPTASATSTTRSGIGVTNTGHAHPRVAAAIAEQADEAAPRPAEHRLPRARAAPVRPAAARPARRAVAGVPVQLRGRGGGGVGQARPGGHGSAGRSSRSATASTAGRPRPWR